MIKVSLCAVLLALVMSLLSPVYAADEAISTRLPNGLKVVMVENHSVPLISVVVAIRSGAATEDLKSNGITHFLEHMLFNGTERRTQQELYDEMDLIGGYNNAFTRKDYTAFIVTAPVREIETALDIQSDMLFNSTMPEEKVEKEKGIVVEEIRKDYTSPDHALGANFDAFVYHGTPYEKTIIGGIPTVQRLTAEEVSTYWKRFYAPNNMTLLAMGDFKPREMLAVIEKYYGQELPREVPSPDDLHLRPIERDLKTVDYHDGIHGSVKLVLQAPMKSDPAAPAFSLLADIAAEDLNAFLKEEAGDKAPQATVMIEDLLAGSRVIVSANVPAGMDDAAVEQLVRQGLEHVAKGKTDSGKLETLAFSKAAEEIRLKENMTYFLMFRAGDVALWGWDLVSGWSKSLEAVTTGEVDALRKKYFAEQPMLTYVARPLPADSDEAAGGDVTYERRVLDNGLTVIVRSDPFSEIFGMHVLVKDRCWREPLGKDGIADLLHRTLLKGGGDEGEEELQRRMDELGLTLKTNDLAWLPMDDYYLSPEYSYMRFAGLDRFYKGSIALLGDILADTRVPDEAVSSGIQSMRMGLGMSAGQPRDVARKLFYDKLYQDGALSRPIMGNMLTLSSITPEDVRSFREGYLSPGNLILSIVTSHAPADVFAAVEDSLGSLPASKTIAQVTKSELKGYPGEQFVEEVGKPQSSIIFSWVNKEVPKEDRTALRVLGSIASDKAAFELREKQGLAYSIGASYSTVGDDGYFALSMGTGPDNLDVARTGIVKVLEEFVNYQLTEKDLKLAVNSTTARMIRYRVKRENQAYYIGLDEYRGVEPGADPTAAWYAVTLDDLERVRAKWFVPEMGFFVIAK